MKDVFGVDGVKVNSHILEKYNYVVVKDGYAIHLQVYNNKTIKERNRR